MTAAPELPPTSVVVVAAGSSSRMGADAAVRKPLLALGGRTVLEHACAAFDALPAVREIVLVGHADDVERLRELARSAPALRKVRRVVAGGRERPDSVRLGVEACDPQSELVAVHDAARPLVERATVERALAEAAHSGAALVAVPVADTLKVAPDGVRAERTVDRSALWAAQTPQVFRLALLRELVARAEREGFRPTDESALHERYVGPVPLVRGSARNLKLTTAEDLRVCAALLGASPGETA